MRGSEVRDKTLIEAALRRDVGWHVYHLGDLDDELYPYTRRFATFDGAEIDRLALFFDRYAPPILLALTDDVDRMVEMLQDMGDLFPRRMHAHLSPAAVGRELLPIAETIGLNVCADNVPAVAAYRRLGFDAVFEYEEMELRRVSLPAAPAHPPPDA